MNTNKTTHNKQHATNKATAATTINPQKQITQIETNRNKHKQTHKQIHNYKHKQA